jgi:spore coat polysaccharide biosynthesis protein SpsF
MLVRVVERTRRARTLREVVVATTLDPGDDAIEALCQQRGYPCYRGSAFDVLDRYYQAASAFQADVVVRITADCPAIDPQVIDEVVTRFLTPVEGDAGSQPWDFAANRLPPPWGRTYPIGLDAEVCTYAGLKTAWEEATLPHQREHVMPFFYEQPERFRILLVDYQENLGKLRWTVDTPADLELLRQIYAHFGGRDDFSWLEVLALFEREPELARLNAGVQHKHYQQVDDRR